MATYIVLGQFTDQGIRGVKDTTKRASAVTDTAKKFGATVHHLYWTLGEHDVVLIVDAPDDTSLVGLLFSLGSLGNVRTQSMRAFEAADIEPVLGRL